MPTGLLPLPRRASRPCRPRPAPRPWRPPPFQHVRRPRAATLLPYAALTHRPSAACFPRRTAFWLLLPRLAGLPLLLPGGELPRRPAILPHAGDPPRRGGRAGAPRRRPSVRPARRASARHARRRSATAGSRRRGALLARLSREWARPPIAANGPRPRAQHPPLPVPARRRVR